MEAVPISVEIQPNRLSAVAGQDTFLAQTDGLAQVRMLEQNMVADAVLRLVC